ncbi:MAG: AAA domain-containing protein [Acidobacteriota bacterium]
MPTPNPILEEMLARLYGAMMRGPQLNASPHGRRQRLDLTQLRRFEDASPEEVFTGLLSSSGQSKIKARVPIPPAAVFEADRERQERAIQRNLAAGSEEPREPVDPHLDRWRAQNKLLQRLRHLGEDAQVYAQETGVEALEVGYPILSLPPGTVSAGKRRILAPIALIGCSITVRSAGRPGLELACRTRDIERVVPNAALFAWLSRELGTELPEDLFADEAGDQPWREIAELVRLVTQWLDLEIDVDAWTSPEAFELLSVPRADKLPHRQALLPSAILGLFPSSNQNLLRDTRDLLERERHEGPIRSFLQAGLSLDGDSGDSTQAPRHLAEDRLLLPADPMQATAVHLARHHRGLVVHGPPGTGKSQTIANIIGDHLCRGERVLFVCDKRTALDVVAHRLKALGLGELCALVHDPQRDRRDLFMHIRGRLDRLPDLEPLGRNAGSLEGNSQDIRHTHGRLDRLRRALSESERPGDSFHEQTGRWFELRGAAQPLTAHLDGVSPDDLQRHRGALIRIFGRGLELGFSTQPWVEAAGITLESLASMPVQVVEDRLRACVEAARAVELSPPARSERRPFEPFGPEQFGPGPLDDQVHRRQELAVHLRGALAEASADRRRVAELREDDLTSWNGRLDRAAEDRRLVADAKRQADLDFLIADQPPTPQALAQQALTLEAFLESHRKWWGFLQFKERAAGRDTLGVYGLAPTPAEGQRLLGFLRWLQGRYRLTLALAELRGEDRTVDLGSAAQLESGLAGLERLLVTLNTARAAGLEASTRRALVDEGIAATLLQGLEGSRARADGLSAFEGALTSSALLCPETVAALRRQARAAESVLDAVERLFDRFRDLEEVLRLRQDLETLPPSLKEGCLELLRHEPTVSAAIDALHRRILEDRLREKILETPELTGLDPRAVERDLAALEELTERRRGLVLDAIKDHWTGLQRRRLLAGSGLKLNSVGASVRQRLFVRGKRAMKLRQVMKIGRDIDYADGGGDPLLDLCPVWMCSPETVAQIFPLEATFDVVIFDEASQCRLEEALPVLARARRVVIAGDPNQLPPTRFFEATVATSDAREIETEDDLFEVRQKDVEDLLGAALQLDVQESYLDVHYRSRHESLIEFSNRHFYGNRLQALPGHPEDLAELAPIQFTQVGGVYEGRRNRKEAEAIVELVDRLLRQPQPPSLGVATFNLVQKDLVLDLLSEKAEADPEFRQRFDRARRLVRSGSFEGLFVKNLENVQGDERDHIIISTTYGVDPEGKFYRRFGPLGTQGGGRRLNVLVTRARHRLHLVTSIPSAVYRVERALPLGGQPSGSWLLLAYLRYAEEAASSFRPIERAGLDLEKLRRQAQEARAGSFEGRSPLVDSVAADLQVRAEPDTTIGRYWGNDGFCIDLTARYGASRRVGLVFDFARYRRAPDAVEWDLFTTGLLRSHGWRLRRCFSPKFFRDPTPILDDFLCDAAAVAEPIPAKESRVLRPASDPEP